MPSPLLSYAEAAEQVQRFILALAEGREVPVDPQLDSLASAETSRPWLREEPASRSESVPLPESAAVTVKLYEPAAVGVPLKIPVVASVRPGGRTPVSEKVTVPVPPVAVIVTVPTVSPFCNGEGVKAIDPAPYVLVWP